MRASALVDRLAGFPEALRAVVGVVAPADARWRPDEKSWAIVEIVAHLADEETEDFRTRLRLTLESPGTLWPPIDPEGAARERKYIERELAAELDRFERERIASVAWLRGLPAGTDWDAAYEHPKFGPIPAGVLLTSWAAHDALHLRQISRRLFQMAARDGSPYPTVYAGEW